MAGTPLPLLMREIGEALRLDGNGNEKVIYLYTTCSIFLGRQLLILHN